MEGWFVPTKKNANKVARVFGLLDEFYFVGSGQYGFKQQTLFVGNTLFAPSDRKFYSF